MARQDGRWRKRRHDTYEEDNQLGVGQTLAYLKGQQHPAQPNVGPLQKTQDSAQGSKDGGDDDDHNDDAAGEWQTVESRASKRRKKLPKMGAANYPSIAHSPHSRLQSYVKLADLQNLVLYLLADGSGPIWCSVAHHANVRKVVVLMVPGLEAGMFDGKIPLSQTDEKKEASSDEQKKKHTADSSAVEQSTTDATSSADASSSSQPIVSNKIIPTPDDYYPKPLEHERLPAQLQPFANMFEHIWPVKAPGDEKLSKMHSPLAAMLVSPLVKSKEEKRAQGPRPPRESKHWKDERTPVTEFIATTSELLEEGYVLHPAHYVDDVIAAEETSRRQTGKMTEADGWLDIPNIGSLSDGVVPDKDIEKGSILRGRKVLTLDCEMCVTSPPGIVPQVYSLTRISIVDWDGAVVMDEYVKPDDEITDYLTPYSGITPAKLEGVTTSLKDIQTKLSTSIITPQTILVGHSLNSDLNALKLTHPYIIDTSILYPHPRGPPLKSGLKWLSKKYLLRDIQQGHGATGHDSVEDARACLDLVKQKCEKGKLWGTSDASNESLFKRLARYKRPKRDKVNPIGDDEPRLGAVVDWGDPNRGFGGQARVTIACKSDDEVVPGVLRALTGDAESDGGSNDDAGDNGGTEVSNGVSSGSGSRVPKGGVDFVFGRLHALEIHRGWNNRQYPTYTEGFNSNYPNANNASDNRTNSSSSSNQQTLSSVVEATVSRISDLHASLPPCTAFIVYSGSSDPRPLAEMQALQQQFKEEYRVKKWDELTVKWTDTEEQRLKQAAREARLGVAFVGVK